MIHGIAIKHEDQTETDDSMSTILMDIYTTIGGLSSTFYECLAERSQFESDHDHIWHACAERSGNGSYLNKLAP